MTEWQYEEYRRKKKNLTRLKSFILVWNKI